MSMPGPLTPFFKMAVENIAAWGDTDVFPLPPENHVFFDRADDVVDLLDHMHGNFQSWRDTNHPVNESALAMVGYTAFRWVTQIDPLWNAYLLGLVLSLASEIEAARVAIDQRVVFSYRYRYDANDKRLFSDGAWRAFNERSLELADTHSHVLVCDIADFYARIYHHRVENSLLFLTGNTEATARRVTTVLGLFSNGTSYGLPVGGPAARILSELLLNRVDRLLIANGITFCRFADDFHIFTTSREDAFDALRFLTEKLLQNEGLTLQRAKTRIISSRDYRAGSDFAQKRTDEVPESDTPDFGETVPTPAAEDVEQQSFLALSLRFDPYSPTAEEDYETLKEQIAKFDVVGMLTRELTKSRIHMALTRRLVQAIRYLEPEARDGAVRTLVDNMDTLSPVLPNVFRATTELYGELTTETRAHVIAVVRDAIREERYFATVPVNLGYAVRLIGSDMSEENQALLSQIYKQAPHFVQRDIVVIMARWRAVYWISDMRGQFSYQHPWVRRALLIASYALEDEGRYWRKRIVGQLSRFDAVIKKWMDERTGKVGWEIPL